MPKTKYYRVGERPPPRGPSTDRLWQPPPRSAPDNEVAPERQRRCLRRRCLRCSLRRRSLRRRSLRRGSARRSLRRRSLRPNSPMPANPETP